MQLKKMANNKLFSKNDTLSIYSPKFDQMLKCESQEAKIIIPYDKHLKV